MAHQERQKGHNQAYNLLYHWFYGENKMLQILRSVLNMDGWTPPKEIKSRQLNTVVSVLGYEEPVSLDEYFICSSLAVTEFSREIPCLSFVIHVE